jgi:hypothetical protein
LSETKQEDAMGILDRLFGQQPPSQSRQPQGAPETLSDEQALERYRYLVRTAPPEAIEEAHREAFERLTPEQRRQVLRELNAVTPANERVTDESRADPRTLARMATRSELRQPGILERSLQGPGLGGMFASSLMGSIVGSVLGSAIAHQMLGGFPHDSGAGDEGTSDAVASDEGEADADDVGDYAGDDMGDSDI